MSFPWFNFSRPRIDAPRPRERQLADLAADIDHRLELRRIGRDQRKAEARARESERLRLQMQRDPLIRAQKR